MDRNQGAKTEYESSERSGQIRIHNIVEKNSNYVDCTGVLFVPDINVGVVGTGQQLDQVQVPVLARPVQTRVARREILVKNMLFLGGHFCLA